MSEWQPIETAPREDIGEQLLYGCYDRDGLWRSAVYFNLSNPEVYKFTHWTRVPEPPQR